MGLLINILITFLVVILVLYLINLLPLEGRAKQIQLLYLNLVAAADDTDAVLSNLAQRNVNRMLKDSEEFANCLRCFEKLFRRSRPEADSVFRDLTEFLDSVSP